MSKCLVLVLLATSQYLTFYDRDNGQTVRVPVGQVVTIKLMVPQGARSGWQPVTARLRQTDSRGRADS